MEKDFFDEIVVVKRSGQRVNFNDAKVAIAVKKGFDSVYEEYDEKLVNKVKEKVLSYIKKNYKDRKTINVEDVQDAIEKVLQDMKYDDVYTSFKEYRERRAASREAFVVKQQHKFVKAIESLGLKTSSEENAKRENANVDGDGPMGTMLHFGSTVSREFAKAYLMDNKYARAHDEGLIHIHDLDFWAMGTTTCTQIDLHKLFKNGFSTGHGYLRTPNSIGSYSALAAIAIQANQNEQHGGQSIPAFDYYMAPGVVKTFKKQFKQTIDDILIYTDLDKFVATNGIDREIEKIETIEFDVSIFNKYSRDSEQVQRIFKIAYNIAMKKTKKLVSQAMEAFVHDTNVIDSNGKEKIYPTINLGTDTSAEGRMIIDMILDSIDFGIENEKERLSPFVIFKVKEGINCNKEDKNYDLYKKAINIAKRRNYPSFSILDASFNKKYYKLNDSDSEVAYNSTNMRVMENVIDEDKQITSQRGNISYTTINLARIGIKNSPIINNENNTKKSKEKQYEQFFNELEEKLNFIKDQLLDRFEIQGNKKVYEFPLFIKQGIWLDGEKAKDEDKIRKIIKQGSLTVGFIGLEECLIALTGKKRTENKDTQKLGIQIVSFMKNKIIKALLLTFSILLIIGVILYLFPFIINLSTHEGQLAFKNEIDNLGVWGIIVLFMLQLLQIVLVVLPFFDS